MANVYIERVGDGLDQFNDRHGNVVVEVRPYPCTDWSVPPHANRPKIRRNGCRRQVVGERGNPSTVVTCVPPQLRYGLSGACGSCVAARFQPHPEKPYAE